MPHSHSTAVPSPTLASLSHLGAMGAMARALIALTKPRLAFFSVVSAMAAYAATVPDPELGVTLTTLLGISFAAGGALSLNQWWERDTDRLMRRTRQRPLPRAQVSAPVALAWSLILSAGGTLLLAWQINLTAAALAAATILIYGVIYTPLKRRSRWATEVGSISGALPPLLGTAAAGDLTAAPGWVLALILLCWQMPHFFAIGWMYRLDYRAAGFPLLPATDPTGDRTAAWSSGYTLALVAVSLLPWAGGHVGGIYGWSALLAGLGMLVTAMRFQLQREAARDRAARQLFLASILYLPWVMAALFLDRWW
jgi:heme o synthase